MIGLSDNRRHQVLFWAKLFARLFGFASISFGVLLKVPAVQNGNLFFNKFNENMWWAFPAVLVLAPVFEFIRRWAERQVLWPLVKALLEDFRSKLYPSNLDGAHVHRVTLFKHSSWVLRKKFFKSFGFGWVYILERTGHTTQNSRTVFRAANDPDKAEGVAGSTWAFNRVSYFEDLPDLSGNPSDRAIAEYAKKTSCPIDEIRVRKPRSRSLCGIPVEVRGRVWGVLVIDSRNVKLPKEMIETHYFLVAKSLGRLLERLT